tara:strand:+ start:255 stop:758 length:504 start_codon:yes stop_codon:yes gene_type:complete
MESIKVIDDILPDNLLKNAMSMLENLPWYYGHRSRPGDIKFWISVLDDRPFFTNTIYEMIKPHLNGNFKLVTVYANGQTYGLDGAYHFDSEDDDTYTFLLYLNDINRDNVEKIGGHILFKEGDTIKSIEPILNRGVFFRSTVRHRGLAPSRLSNILRTSIAFKLLKC